MITKQRTLFYFVGDQAFKSLEDAQAFDLMALMDSEIPPEQKVSWASWMLQHSKAIVDTLTTTPKSRLRGRKIHGAVRKPRASKSTAGAVPA